MKLTGCQSTFCHGIQLSLPADQHGILDAIYGFTGTHELEISYMLCAFRCVCLVGGGMVSTLWVMISMLYVSVGGVGFPVGHCKNVSWNYRRGNGKSSQSTGEAEVRSAIPSVYYLHSSSILLHYLHSSSILFNTGVCVYTSILSAYQNVCYTSSILSAH